MILSKQGFMSQEFPFKASFLAVSPVLLRGNCKRLGTLISLSTLKETCKYHKHNLLYTKAFQRFLMVLETRHLPTSNFLLEH